MSKLTLLLMFIAINTTVLSNTHPKLLIKIPTRSRPEKFFEKLDLYYNKLSHTYPYHFLITCDVDDTSMNNSKVIAKLNQCEHLTYSFSRNKTKIEAYNKDIDKFINDFDILLVASDDMEPIAANYDEIIIKTMLQHFPDFDGVLNFNDGHTLQQKINTYPVIGNKFYRRFGYAYFPGYKSFYCDEELKCVSQLLQKEIVLDTVLLYHNHPGLLKNGGKLVEFWDPLYQKNQKDAHEDKELFQYREKQFFYLPEVFYLTECNK